MATVSKIFQPQQEMNYIPGVGRFICLAAATQKARLIWQNLITLKRIDDSGRTEVGDKARAKADSLLNKLPGMNNLAKRFIPDSYRSVLHNLKPLGENLGWVLLLTGCATNHFLGTATLGLLFSIYARPWTTKTRDTQWPLAGGCILWTAILYHEPLHKIIPIVTQAIRPLL